MFYIIFFAVIVFALVVIFQDDGRDARRRQGQASQKRTVLPPENPKPIQPARPTPVMPEVPKPAQPRTRPDILPPRPAIDPVTVPDRTLSWSFLYSLEYDGNLVPQTLETEITGMRYYCTLADLGPVNGTVSPEPENPHDPHAQVVVRSDGKKMGYIPRYLLPEYEDFNPKGRVCPFAGRVTVDRKGYMHANIRVALPSSREEVKKALSEAVSLKSELL